MRIRFLIIVISISAAAYSQKLNEPFIGGVEFGIGYGTIIDFYLDNNNFYSEYMLERLIWLPFQIGVLSQKHINPNEYLEFGMLFARRSSSFVNRHNNSPEVYGTGLPTLNLYSIDIPLKYYTYAGKMIKRQMYAYGGIIPSWLMKPEGGSIDGGIPEPYFRKVYLSVCGGLGHNKKKSRLKLHAGLAVTSVVGPGYREIPQEIRKYGGRVYPFELLFCYSRFFK